MKRLSYILVILIGTFMQGFCQEKPVSHPNMNWEYKADYSDEFNGATLDSKWNTDVRDWGTWAWEPENAYVRENSLVLRMKQQETVRKVSGADKKFYFTSGIAQIPATITYGYFETRIKASSKGQGTCPAFWLYSTGQPTPTEEGGTQYSEIDVIEIFQIPNQLKRLEMNLHTRIIENGVLTWKRPGQGNTELCHNSWDATWDPRDEYHTYGVMNRVDSIFWYVDGVERGRKKNHYWHLPMHVTVSMGLRTPYEKYISGVRTVMEYPESSPEAGFPTEMFCDYVRVWEAPAQIIVDRDKYQNVEFSKKQGILNFECYYDAGSGYKVLSDDWGGLTVKLVEKTSEGNIVNEISKVDALALTRSAGHSMVSFDISEKTNSDELASGNYYALIPVFKSSKNDGTDVHLDEELKIRIVEKNVSVEDELALSKVFVYPNPASSTITVQGVSAVNYQVKIYDVKGVLYANENKINAPESSFSVANLPKGIYCVAVKTGDAQKVIKFSKE